jgi:hydroxypyruvate isomerase
MPRFSANLSMLFNEVPLLQRFALARQHGFDAVEIQFPYALSAAEIRAQLDQHRLHLCLFNVDAADLLQGGEGLAAVPEQRDAFATALQQTCDYARVLQPDYINVLPGRCYAAERRAAYRATLIDNLRLAATQLAQLQIGCVFEAINHIDMPGFLIADSADAWALWQEVAHPNLQLQFDIYHRARMGEDVLAVLQQQLPQIGHIQFADYPGRGAPGSGELDFDALFAAIAAGLAQNTARR